MGDLNDRLAFGLPGYLWAEEIIIESPETQSIHRVVVIILAGDGMQDAPLICQLYDIRDALS